MLTDHDLGHRELHLLRVLDCQQRGVPIGGAGHLTPDEYTSVVMGLRSRGLVGADVHPVRDDYSIGAAAWIVDRVWLTVEGRAYLRGESVAA